MKKEKAGWTNANKRVLAIGLAGLLSFLLFNLYYEVLFLVGFHKANPNLLQNISYSVTFGAIGLVCGGLVGCFTSIVQNWQIYGVLASYVAYVMIHVSQLAISWKGTGYHPPAIGVLEILASPLLEYGLSFYLAGLAACTILKD